MKNFDIMGPPLKIPILGWGKGRGGGGGGHGQFADLRGGLAKEIGVFEGELIP